MGVFIFPQPTQTIETHMFFALIYFPPWPSFSIRTNIKKAAYTQMWSNTDNRRTWSIQDGIYLSGAGTFIWFGSFQMLSPKLTGPLDVRNREFIENGVTLFQCVQKSEFARLFRFMVHGSCSFINFPDSLLQSTR